MKQTKSIFPYEWTLKDAIFTKDKGKVFSCFSCGGGSTMGYKLAGFDVIGCNEIDPKMFDCYIENHNPKYPYLEDIRTFRLRDDLPQELYELDILDGSPPCSSFSIAGNTWKDWGKEKVFREGQTAQVLDTLFFEFIELANRLQPKVVVAENVKGLMQDVSFEYVKRIYKEFEQAGYNCQHFVLDASKMGVPQKRERVFFIAIRNDLVSKVPFQNSLFQSNATINMMFNHQPILFKEINDGLGRPITDHAKQAWDKRDISDTKLSHSKLRAGMKETDFNCHYAFNHKVLNTLTAKGQNTFIHYDKPIYISETEYVKASTFPVDYDFKEMRVFYLCGMSVPPVMTAQIATRIYDQWIVNLVDK